MASCSFKEIVKSDCHSGKNAGNVRELYVFDDLNPDVWKELLWKAGKADADVPDDITLCRSHKLSLDSKFRGKNCANPFKHERHNAKKQASITLDLAKKVLQKDTEVIPGQPVCRKCLEQLNYLADHGDSHSDTDCSQASEEAEALSASARKKAKEDTDSILESLGESPLKLHGLKPTQKENYAKEKLKRTSGKLGESLAMAIGSELPESANDDDKELAVSMRELLQDLKDRIAGESNYAKKVQMLTLTPKSWSRKKTSEFFGVTEYMVRKANDLRENDGILAMPSVFKRQRIDPETLIAVQAIYEDDQNSRQMPGAKDCISVNGTKHQKRLLLVELKELYRLFKEEHPNKKIGFSKFCSLRPRWCILTGSSGTHNVCTCKQHENVKLLCDVMDDDYKELTDIIVCSRENRECMMHRCNECPGIDKLREHLLKDYTDEELEEEIVYQQWDSTDRTQMTTLISPLTDFIETLLTAIDGLTTHSYTAKQQNAYYKQRKENLETNTILIQCDFAENFQFVIQDEVQSYHWSKQYCTLHPVVIYYRDENGMLTHKSFCFISNDLTHDNAFVHRLEKDIFNWVKVHLPHVTHAEYFTDGCAGQYKSYKNFLNLCYHKEDFGLTALWNFFATSHGKGACDGIGGTVKRLVALESLRRVKGNYILSAKQMFRYCQDKIENITFFYIPKTEMEQERPLLEVRYESGETVPGTQSYHQFYALNVDTVGYKRLSSDNFQTGCYTFKKIYETEANTDLLDVGVYVAVVYDLDWYVGLIEQMDRERKECMINFMHPKQPTGSVFWPRSKDKCLVPFSNIMRAIDVPVSASVTSRTYNLTKDEHTDIVKQYALVLSKNNS